MASKKKRLINKKKHESIVNNSVLVESLEVRIDLKALYSKGAMLKEYHLKFPNI